VLPYLLKSKIYRFGFQNMTVTYFRKSKFASTHERDTNMKGLEIGLFFVLTELYFKKKLEHWNLHTVTLKPFVHYSVANPGRPKLPLKNRIKIKSSYSNLFMVALWTGEELRKEEGKN
jgi:hypothetical protein